MNIDCSSHVRGDNMEPKVKKKNNNNKFKLKKKCFVFLKKKKKVFGVTDRHCNQAEFLAWHLQANDRGLRLSIRR